MAETFLQLNQEQPDVLITEGVAQREKLHVKLQAEQHNYRTHSTSGEHNKPLM